MLSSIIGPTIFAGLVAAADYSTNIYVASYDGNVTTLQFSQQDSSFSLQSMYVNPDCHDDPVWLQLDYENRVLYCLDEGDVTGVGTVNIFHAASDGQLDRFQRVNVTDGPVNSIFFNGGRGMAIAHYGGGAVTALNVSSDDQLSGGQALQFKLSAPGPEPAQYAPHPHEVILDPTGGFILVPDLGADLVRIFSVNQSTNLLTALDPVTLTAGTGPRHGTFWSPTSPYTANSALYFYLIAELSNTITSFSVSYSSDGAIQLTEIGLTNSFGGGEVPKGTAAAEIAVSPDNRFLVASNRGDSSFTIPNFDPANSTPQKSDTLAVFQPSSNGSISLVQLAPAGGSYPRQFQINKAGDKIVLGLQVSQRVVVIERDVASGKIGNFLANITVPGGITTTLWDE